MQSELTAPGAAPGKPIDRSLRRQRRDAQRAFCWTPGELADSVRQRLGALAARMISRCQTSPKEKKVRPSDNLVRSSTIVTKRQRWMLVSP